jgi:hypothetical protein
MLRTTRIAQIEPIIAFPSPLWPFQKINDPLVGPTFRERAKGVLADETVAGPFPECGWILIFLK